MDNDVLNKVLGLIMYKGVVSKILEFGIINTEREKNQLK